MHVARAFGHRNADMRHKERLTNNREMRSTVIYIILQLSLHKGNYRSYAFTHVRRY